MKIYLLKALSIVIFCFSFALLTDVKSMDRDMNRYDDETSHITAKLTLNDSDNNCTHWGLTRWCCGIGESCTENVLCTPNNDLDDGERAYFVLGVYSKDNTHRKKTDCWFTAAKESIVGPVCSSPWWKFFVDLPISAVTHLVCLPRACCSPEKNVRDWKLESWEFQ